MAIAPSIKVTVPVGMPVPGATGATAAVKITDSPATEGLAELVKVVMVTVAINFTPFFKIRIHL